MFENPSASMAGRVMAALSVFFILISTISFCLETLPQFKDDDSDNSTSMENMGPLKPWDPSKKSFPFWVIESICIVRDQSREICEQKCDIHFLLPDWLILVNQSAFSKSCGKYYWFYYGVYYGYFFNFFIFLYYERTFLVFFYNKIISTIWSSFALFQKTIRWSRNV